MRAESRRHIVRATAGAVFLILAAILGVGEARADSVLTLTTWRIEPSTVKENQPWTVKVWVGNIGSEPPKKPTVVQVLGCDKDYAKCETVYATQEIKTGTAGLAPNKLPGHEVVMDIKQGLAKGEHFILIVVDPKKDNGAPIRKQVRVPVGFQKF